MTTAKERLFPEKLNETQILVKEARFGFCLSKEVGKIFIFQRLSFIDDKLRFAVGDE